MTTQNKRRGNSFTEQELKLLGLLPKKEEHDVGDLSEALEVSSEEIIRIAYSLSKRGYRITYDGAKNVLRLVGEKKSGEIKYLDIGKVLNHFKIGLISETRIGAKQEQIRLLRGVYEEFARQGVSFVIHAGNLTVGKPDSGSSLTSIRPDVFLFKAQEQRDFVVKHFPRAGKKIKTYLISGRRDLTFRGKQAYSIVQDICQRRPDFVFCGDKTCTFPVRELKIRVMNPYDDNGPMGKTYGVQQIADSLDDPRPDILLVAGMHRYGFMPDYWNDGRGDVCLIPSMHSQMTRQSNKRAPVRPDIGFAILDINFNETDANGRPKIMYTGYNLNPYADYSGSEHFEEYPEHDGENLAAEESEILKWLHEASEFGVTVGEITRRLKKNRTKVNSIIAHLQELGYPITIPEDIKRAIIQRKIRQDFPATHFKVEKESDVGALSDSHLTSAFQQIKLLRRSYDMLGQRGIENVIHAGDVSEGPPSGGYPGHGIDVVGGDPEKLLDYVVERYPRLILPVKNKQGRTFVISGGSHDGWYVTRGGLNFVRALAKRRSDLRFLGHELGAVIINDVFYYVLHPKGAAGDTISRKLEMFIRKARNRKNKGLGHPLVMLLGHWHRAFAMFDRNALGLLVPCMKSEDNFHATLGLVPQVGFWIIKTGLDSEGNILSFTPEYFGFSEGDIDTEDYKDIHEWAIKQRAEEDVGDKNAKMVKVL